MRPAALPAIALTLQRHGNARFAALAVAIALVAACAARDAPRHDAPAPRVVSLNPAATAIVAALGAGDHLVGVTRYCEAPGAPVLGDMNPRPEQVLARTPDLVLAGDYPSQAALRDQLTALDVAVLALPLVRLADQRAATLTLGARLDRGERAAELAAALDAALARAAARAAARPPVRVLLVFDVEQGYVYTTGGGDHTAELLAAAGATNIAAGGPLTSRLALDAVLARAPDLILHVAPSPRFPDAASARAHWASLPDLPAVRAGHVHVWPDDQLAQNGPWIGGPGGALDRLGDLLDRVAAAPSPAP